MRSLIELCCAQISATMAAADDELRPFEVVVNEFLRKLKFLTNDMRRRFPGDAVIDRAHKRIMLAADLLPVDVIDAMGPYLMRYQEEIDSDDPEVWARFYAEGSENVFQADVRSAKDAENQELATYIVPRLQAHARQESFEVRRDYLLRARGLIDDYLDYLEHRHPT